MSDLATRMEEHLLAWGDWIPGGELASLFGVDEREFRGTDGGPGLLSDFAISGNKGFRHIKRCTADEWEHFSNRIRRHGVGELVRVRRLRQRRGNLATVTPVPPPLVFERVTGQAVMFPELQEVG